MTTKKKVKREVYVGARQTVEITTRHTFSTLYDD